MGPALAGVGRPPLRRGGPRARPTSIDTPPPDRLGVAPRRPRLQLHADRRARALPAHARARTSSTRWAGTTTGCRPSAGCRTTSTCAASRTSRTSPGSRLAMADDAARKQPPRRVSRANFIELCLALTAEDEKAFKALWQRLGLSVDWTLEYSTIDERSRRARAVELPRPLPQGPGLPGRGAHAVGRRLPDGGRAGRGRGPPAARRLPRRALRRRGRRRAFVIATTRPELLPACVGVAAHPEDERYRPLFGKRAVTPLFRVPVPIFPSELVDREKGTGILMVCTFGDATDVQWWREQGLALRQVVGRDGRLVAGRVRHARAGRASTPAAANAAYAAARGQDGREAQKAIVELLRDPAGCRGGRRPAAARRRAAAASSTRSSSTRRATARSSSSPRASGSCASSSTSRRSSRPASAIALAPRLHAPALPQLDGEPEPRLVHQPPALLRRAVPGLVPGRRRTARPTSRRRILADEDDAADRPDDATLPPGYTEAQRDQPGGFAGEADVFDTWFTSLAHAADRDRAGSATRSATGGSSRWTCGRRATRSSAPGPSTRSRRRCCTRTTIPWRHVGDLGLGARPRPQEDVEEQGQRGHARCTCSTSTAPTPCATGRSPRALGTDTAFDEKVLKVGRRLVTKLFNAGEVRARASRRPSGPVTHPLDRAFLARLRETRRRRRPRPSTSSTTRGRSTPSSAFFWSGFTDNYVELVKARARSETDAGGPRLGGGGAAARARASLLRLLRAVPALRDGGGLVVGLRARRPGARSIHRAPWPSPAEFAGARRGGRTTARPSTPRAPSSRRCGGRRARRARRSAGTSRACASRRARATPRSSRPCRADLAAAARVEGEILAAREGLATTALRGGRDRAAPKPPTPAEA